MVAVLVLCGCTAGAPVFSSETKTAAEAAAVGSVPATREYDAERDSPGPVVSEREIDRERFMADDARFFRAFGSGRGGTEATAYDAAFADAKSRLLTKLDSEITVEEREKNGASARERRSRARGRLRNISVAEAETRHNAVTGIFTVSVGIEFPKENLEDDKAAVVVERVPEPWDTDWREFGAATFPAEIAGLKNSFLDGEKASITVTPSRDAYLTVFWVSADGRADVTFPRGGGSAAFLPGGVPFALPEITLRVDDPAAREEALRLIFVLTSEPREFRRPDGQDFFEALPLETVSSWLTSLPRGSRFIRVQPATIFRK